MELGDWKKRKEEEKRNCGIFWIVKEERDVEKGFWTRDFGIQSSNGYKEDSLMMNREDWNKIGSYIGPIKISNWKGTIVWITKVGHAPRFK